MSNGMTELPKPYISHGEIRITVDQIDQDTCARHLYTAAQLEDYARENMAPLEAEIERLREGMVALTRLSQELQEMEGCAANPTTVDGWSAELKAVLEVLGAAKGGVMDQDTQEFEVWSEGFSANGDRGGAVLHGIAAGHDFAGACLRLAQDRPEFAQYFDPVRMTFWGCRLFDNEADARASYG